MSISSFGKRTRNAPIRPATAPDAPIVGTMLAEFVHASICVAAMPKMRYSVA
jgi:hypothetical protein